MAEQSGEDSQTLKKTVAAVHICNVSLMQRKLHNALMYLAVRSKPLRSSTEEYQIPLTTLMTLIGYKSNNIAYLKESLVGLSKNNVEWNLFNDKHKEVEWGTASLLASARIRGGICFFSFPPPLERMLRNPELYAKIDLRVQRRFSSKYSLALYENVIRFVNLGYTRWIELSLLRKILGIEDEEELEFKYLNRLLKKAIEAVNEESNLAVDIEYKRKGRRVDAVRFLVKYELRLPELSDIPLSHPQLPPIDQSSNGALNEVGVAIEMGLVTQNIPADVNPFGRVSEPTSARAVQDDLLGHLCSYLGFESSEAERLIAEYGEEFIRSHLSEVEEKYRQGKIRWVRPYLTSALKKASVSIRSIIEEERRGVEQEKLALRHKVTDMQRQEQQQKEIERKYLAYRRAVLEEIIKTLSSETIENLDRAFAVSVRGTVYQRTYQSRGFESPTIQSLYEDFIIEQLIPGHPELSKEFFAQHVENGCGQ